MVIGIEPHILEVVMFPAYAKAFLSVRDPPVAGDGVAQKVVFELYHARIGEEQGRVIF